MEFVIPSLGTLMYDKMSELLRRHEKTNTLSFTLHPIQPFTRKVAIALSEEGNLESFTDETESLEALPAEQWLESVPTVFIYAMTYLVLTHRCGISFVTGDEYCTIDIQGGCWKTRRINDCIQEIGKTLEKAVSYFSMSPQEWEIYLKSLGDNPKVEEEDIAEAFQGMAMLAFFLTVKEEFLQLMEAYTHAIYQMFSSRPALARELLDHIKSFHTEFIPDTLN